MTSMPPETLYHRTLGWHAPALRRTGLVAALGLIVAILLLPFVRWELALLGGWDAAALAFLATVWPVILRVDGAHTRLLATREDETRGSSVLMLLGACVASLLGVGYALGLAGHGSRSLQVLLIAAAMLTVVLSWTVLNTVYTLHYTHLYYGSAAEGIEFGDGQAGAPDYRDFAYIAFTIGMTYQVSDTTLRHPRIRRTVLVHALLSYL
ncbi:MAG TPA: DUF1345 domain-containing protein, partial [Streptosporangiaceae bacterium]|nr:DUF1345 domain-containing protein [Streptosporangiaceae bacterium]